MSQQVQIVISDNKFCIIKSDDYELLRAIDQQFSYKQDGIQWSRAVQTGRWDGTTHLLHKNKLPLGLLDNLKDFLATIDYSASIDDHRPELVIAPEIDLKAKLARLNTPLRDYQERIVETAFQSRKGIIRACTGAGKTLSAAALIAKINQSAVIYVIGLDLLGQFHATLSELFDEKIGYIGNGVCDIQRITVASVWSVGRALGLKKDIVDDDATEKEIVKAENSQAIIELLRTAHTHLFDECHVVNCMTLREVFKAINPQRIYGMSATWQKGDNTDLTSIGILGPQIIDISASELIEKGWLAKPYIKFVHVPKISGEPRDYHSIYRDYIVENKTRNKLIVENTKQLLAKGYKVLSLFRMIRHGEILSEMFADAGIEVEMLSGQDSLEHRNEVKEKLQTGKLQAVLASTIFDLGVDISSLSALVLCSGGKSIVRSTQRIGRVIRKYPGKEQVAVVDFIDHCKYLQQHSQARYNTYKMENGFVVKWPGK